MDGGEAGPVAEGTMPSPAASVGLESTPSRSDPQSLCTRINGNLLKLLMPRLHQTKETHDPQGWGQASAFLKAPHNNTAL